MSNPAQTGEGVAAARGGAAAEALDDEPAPGGPASPRELELLQRLRARDARAFSALVDESQGPLLRLALGFVSSRAVAEEVVQQTWVSVIEGLDKFEGRSSLKTWIFRILVNRAKSRAVRENRTVPFSALAEAEPGDDAPAVDAERFRANGAWGIPPRRWEADTPERVLMNQQALRALEEALAGLPPNQRAVVTLRDVEGLDSAEVCNVLGLSETNQRVLLHRGRSKLRLVLEDCVERK